MTKLIGTNPNQVPSNADLGTAAFVDAKEFLLSKGSELSAINAVINKTALDVFVYDTSKDSDGGAWRKRTQHTSWYNERLNTTTRGKRKEFPVVAVVVVTGTQMIIYDGDDINLPMWMTFTRSSGSGNFFDATQPQTVSAKNGILYPAGTGGSILINFISEYNAFRNTTRQYNKGNISERNSGKGWVNIGGSDVLIHNNINDVAMTVLSNAPIDPATELPVPTIAVATHGGVSVIKDDETVVDITGHVESPTDVHFNSDKELVATGEYDQMINVYDIPKSDITVAGYKRRYSYHQAPKIDMPEDFVYRTNDIVSESNTLYLARQKGLVALDENKKNKQSGLVSFITSDYNTGWMNGDIKLATLSDTSTSYAYDHSGITFRDSGRISSHTYTTGATSWTVTDDPSNGTEGYFGLTIPTEGGKQYTIYHTRSVLLGNNQQNHIQFISGDNSFIYWGDGTTDLTDNITFTAQGSSVRYVVYSKNNATTTHTINVTLAEQDRRFNGKGLQVFGTVLKTPVATGADLVAYSGFSTNSYLEQPYNSDLDYGTGDFCVMGWLNQTSTTTQVAFWRGHWTGSAHANVIGLVYAGSGLYLETYGTANGGTANTAPYAIPLNKWVQIVGVRSNGKLKIYIDGKLISSGASSTHNVSNSTNTTKIGGGTRNGLYPYLGSMALWRVSSTVPSSEQVKKMYNDEKHLFQENAKATIYGTSDAVTALAYDDDTELLHAGTSAGRSVFQGLRRIDNTTDAVGAAISASNGMVAED